MPPGGSLQARMSEHDPRLYNVNRDVAWNFKEIITEVAGRVEDGKWEPLNQLMQEKGITPEQQGEGIAAICRFVAGATDIKKESMGVCLQRCGFYDIPDYAQVAIMAYLGTVILGVYWHGAHEATMGGVGPCATYQDLADAGAKCHKLLALPKWRRKLNAFVYRIQRAWNTLRGKE